jgi:hypothetical protein
MLRDVALIGKVDDRGGPARDQAHIEGSAIEFDPHRMTLTAVNVIRVGPSGHAVTIQKRSAVDSANEIRTTFSIGGRKSGTCRRELCWLEDRLLEDWLTELEDWLTGLEASTRASATPSRA